MSYLSIHHPDPHTWFHRAMAGDQDLLNTTEAAALIQRSAVTIRQAIQEGRLPHVGRTELGRPLVRRSDLLAWSRTSRPRHSNRNLHSSATVDRTHQLLCRVGEATPSDLAAALGLHPGNVRKHLVILAAQGEARRQADGTWTAQALTSAGAA